jgi:hypothetical protein
MVSFGSSRTPLNKEAFIVCGLERPFKMDGAASVAIAMSYDWRRAKFTCYLSAKQTSPSTAMIRKAN